MASLLRRASRRMRECPDCGLLQRLPELPEGGSVRCTRCRKTLARRHAVTPRAWLACAISGTALYVAAILLPFMSLRIAGRLSVATVPSAPEELDAQGAATLAVVVVAALIVVPAARLACWIGVLAAANTPTAPRWATALFRAVHVLSPWAMIEVFLLGALVAHGRLAALGSVDVGLSFVALAATVLVTTILDWSVDRETLWRTLAPAASAPASSTVPAAWVGCAACGQAVRARSGDRCPRCRAVLHARKPNSIARTWALVIAAALLYVPSNLLPVLSLVRLGKRGPRTILGGVVELGQSNLWGLAAIVFVASLVIPLLKLISLTTMLVMTHRRSARGLVGRTRLLRFVDAVGRWSMVDIFVLTTLVALVRVPFFAVVLREGGATAFAAVVVLTMLAAAAFDPRLMWDAPERVAP